MPGHKPHPIPERPEIVDDRVDQLLVIAFREVRPANRAAEQDVADKGELARLVIDDDMARGVAGAVGDAETLVAQGQRVAFFEIAGRDDILAVGNAIAGALGLDLVEQPLVILVRANNWTARAL